MPPPFSDSRPALVIVDDDPDQLSLLRIAAERVRSYRRIITAEDGAAALSQVIEFFEHTSDLTPLIILTDLKMPRVNGIELAKTLQSHPSVPPVHVVAMSNSRYQPDVQAALTAGCCAFFQKPGGFQQLKEILLSLPALCTRKTRDCFAETVESFV